MAEKRIVRLITSIFDRASAAKVETEFEQSLARAGSKGGDAFLREMRAAFAQRTAQLREQLAAGIIDKAEFRKQSDLAAKAFNDGLLKSIQKARAEGKLTDQEYTKLAKNFKRVGDEGSTAWDRIKRGIVTAGASLLAVFGARRLFQFGQDSIRAATEAEAAWSRLDGALQSVGLSMAQVGADVHELADEMMRTTSVGDEQFADVLTNLVQITGDYEASLRNVSVVADFAAARQIDLDTAATLVGKAMIGQTDTLKRYGVVVEEGADAVEVLRQKFKGMAEREGETLRGKIAQLSNAWGEFKEALGAALIDSSNGASILDNLTTVVRVLTEHMADLVALVVNLGKALVVAGVVTGMLRLGSAIRAADLATKGWIATMRVGMAAIGPVGWFILAVGALTAAFQKMGQAQRDATQAQNDLIASMQGMSGLQLDQQIASLTSQIAGLQKQLEAADSVFAKVGFQRQINALREAGLEAVRLRIQLQQLEGAATGGGGGGGPVMLDPITVSVGQSTGTDKGAPVFGTGKSFGGILAGKNGLKELEAGLLDIESAAQQAAAAMSNAFQDAFTRIGEDGFTLADGIQSVFAGMAGSALKAVSDTAKTEAAKEFAYALSMAAHALGFGAFGNLASAGAAAGSATQHVAAGLAWTALAGASGAGASALSGRGGHGRNSLPDGRDAGVGRAAGTERAGPEVNIYLSGEYDMMNPQLQRVIYGTVQQATERFGPNAKVTVKPSSR